MKTLLRAEPQDNSIHGVWEQEFEHESSDELWQKIDTAIADNGMKLSQYRRLTLTASLISAPLKSEL